MMYSWRPEKNIPRKGTPLALNDGEKVMDRTRFPKVMKSCAKKMMRLGRFRTAHPMYAVASAMFCEIQPRSLFWQFLNDPGGVCNRFGLVIAWNDWRLTTPVAAPNVNSMRLKITSKRRMSSALLILVLFLLPCP